MLVEVLLPRGGLKHLRQIVLDLSRLSALPTRNMAKEKKEYIAGRGVSSKRSAKAPAADRSRFVGSVGSRTGKDPGSGGHELFLRNTWSSQSRRQVSPRVCFCIPIQGSSGSGVNVHRPPGSPNGPDTRVSLNPSSDSGISKFSGFF